MLLIENVATGRRLFAQRSRDGAQGFGATTGLSGAADQLWILEARGTGFVIRNHHSGRCLFATETRKSRVGFGAILSDSTPDGASIIWTILLKDSGTAEIRHAASGRYLYADRTDCTKDANKKFGATTDHWNSAHQHWLLNANLPVQCKLLLQHSDGMWYHGDPSRCNSFWVYPSSSKIPYPRWATHDPAMDQPPLIS